MATSMQIGQAGIELVTIIAVLIMFTFLGGIVIEQVIMPVLGNVDPAHSVFDPGNLTFIGPLYYGLMLLLGITAVIRAYKQIVVQVDYYPGGF